MIEKLVGVYVPTIVPLDDTQRIDLRSFGRHVEYLIAGGVHGLWVNGSSGDFHALSDGEQTEVVRAAVEYCAGRVPVIAHVGDTATRLVVTKARAALEAGADRVSVILPYYLEYSEPELTRHLRLISQSIGQPILMYQNPATCRHSLSIPAIIQLVREGVVVGIKESSTDLDRYGRLIRAAREANLPLRCFLGAGGLARVGLEVGGDGLICAISNIVPNLCVRLHSQMQAACWDEATITQERINAVNEAFSRSLAGRSNWAPIMAAYKWVLRELGVIASAAAFDPLIPLSNDEIGRLRQHALPLAHDLNSGLLATLGYLPAPRDAAPSRFVTETSTETV